MSKTTINKNINLQFKSKSQAIIYETNDNNLYPTLKVCMNPNKLHKQKA